MKAKHPKVGKRVMAISGGYEGREGTIFYCNTCCRKYRIQWDKIGNNISLADMRYLKWKWKYLSPHVSANNIKNKIK
jgi:hypothetical protein